MSHKVKGSKTFETWSGNVITERFFFKNHAENEPGRLFPELFLFFKKALWEVKGNGPQLSFNHFR